MKAVVIEKVDGKPGQVYYPLKTIDLPIPTPSPTEVVIKILAAALNHKDLFIRQHLYPGTAFNIPLLGDGVGIVVAAGTPELESQWKGKRVILAPGRGWDRDPTGPETGNYATLGGTKFFPNGTLQEFISFPADSIELAPLHMTNAEAAALPLCGLTAYRATFTKGQVSAGQNVLVTGIGGGVALNALQFAAARGATVFVTSSSPEKLRKAKELGASAGVNYRNPGWEKELAALLPRTRPFLDAVIDGAGGEIVEKSTGLLKHGGIIVSYGLTMGPSTPFTIKALLKNIEMRGSTMGSRKEFTEMVDLVRNKQIHPVISHSVHGFEKVDELFEVMRKAENFGKLVVMLADEGDHVSKL
ncbi:hypothetical protein DFH27DRAFT_487678 [Peziza echinospora]|nr:hypothetical protein DFH27DRAFT_487678 [Peziza echinospora]